MLDQQPHGTAQTIAHQESGAQGLTQQPNGLPSVSAIVAPAHDPAPFQACLNSLVAQDFQDLEVVIAITDGATEMNEIANRYCARHKNFRSICAKSVTRGSAFNAGIDASLGSFVTFVSGNDCLATNAINTLCKAQASSNCDIVTGQVIRLNTKGDIVQDEPTAALKKKPPVGWHGSEEWLRVLGDFAPATIHGRLFRRSLLTTHRLSFPETWPDEHLFFTYKALHVATSSCQIDNPTYFDLSSEQDNEQVATEVEVDAIFAQLVDTKEYLEAVSAPAIATAAAARQTLFQLGNVRSRSDPSLSTASQHLDRSLAKHKSLLAGILEHFEKSSLAGAYVDRRGISLIRRITAPGAAGAGSIAVSDAQDFSDERQAPAQFPAEPVDFAGYHQADVTETSLAEADRLGMFYNQHMGRRCFIVGSGRALAKHDLSKLEGEQVFASGAAAAHLLQRGIAPTFCVAEQGDVQAGNVHSALSCDAEFKFIPAADGQGTGEGKVFRFAANRGILEETSPYYGVPRFSTDPTKQVFLGHPDIFNCLQFAFFMGFTEVYVIGAKTPVEIAREQISYRPDVIADQGIIVRNAIKQVEMGYLQAKLAFDAVGRKVYDATIGVSLYALPHADYDSLFLKQEKQRQELHKSKGSVPTNGARAGSRGKRLRKLWRDPHKYLADSKFKPIRPLRHMFRPHDKNSVKPRSKLRAKYLRDPYLYFADSKTVVLRPLKYLFAPTGWSNTEYEIVEAGRKRASGLLSRLPVSRKRLSGEIALLNQQHASMNEQLKTQKSTLSRSIANLREEIHQAAHHTANTPAQSTKDGTAEQAAVLEQRLLTQAMAHIQREAQLHDTIDELRQELAALKRAFKDAIS